MGAGEPYICHLQTSVVGMHAFLMEVEVPDCSRKCRKEPQRTGDCLDFLDTNHSSLITHHTSLTSLMAVRTSKCIGLARTVYIHRM